MKNLLNNKNCLSFPRSYFLPSLPLHRLILPILYTLFLLLLCKSCIHAAERISTDLSESTTTTEFETAIPECTTTTEPETKSTTITESTTTTESGYDINVRRLSNMGLFDATIPELIPFIKKHVKNHPSFFTEKNFGSYEQEAEMCVNVLKNLISNYQCPDRQQYERIIKILEESLKTLDQYITKSTQSTSFPLYEFMRNVTKNMLKASIDCPLASQYNPLKIYRSLDLSPLSALLRDIAYLESEQLLFRNQGYLLKYVTKLQNDYFFLIKAGKADTNISYLNTELINMEKECEINQIKANREDVTSCYRNQHLAMVLIQQEACVSSKLWDRESQDIKMTLEREETKKSRLKAYLTDINQPSSSYSLSEKIDLILDRRPGMKEKHKASTITQTGITNSQRMKEFLEKHSALIQEIKNERKNFLADFDEYYTGITLDLEFSRILKDHSKSVEASQKDARKIAGIEEEIEELLQQNNYYINNSLEEEKKIVETPSLDFTSSTGYQSSKGSAKKHKRSLFDNSGIKTSKTATPSPRKSKPKSKSHKISPSASTINALHPPKPIPSRTGVSTTKSDSSLEARKGASSGFSFSSPK